MTTIEIVPLPGDPAAHRFALVVEQDGATELQVALWKQFGEECGAASTVVGETPIVVIDRTRELPALLAPIVAPGPCPSILNISPFTSGPICCELLATHLGRHTDGKTIWGEVEPYETAAGTVGIIDRGAGTVAQTSAIFSEETPQQPLADPPASHVHRWMPQTSLGTFYYCAWKAADGSAVCTAVTRYPASELPYGLNVPVPASFMIHPPAGLLVEQLSADVNDEPPVNIEEHTHDWENLGSTPTSSGDLYRCTHLWEAGDRCDALFYAMTDFGPPQGQIGRRVTRPDGTSKTQTLPEGQRGL